MALAQQWIEHGEALGGIQLRRFPSLDHERSPMSDAKPIVFVVDDDPSVRKSLGLLVESAGWQPETFGSGREFLSRPRVVAPSCLVLDVILPDLSGCDLQALLTDRADMPIIFISGRADVATSVRAMKAGAVEFFTKPFADDAIVNAIRGAINRSCAALADIAELRALQDGYGSLSPREREVMALVVSGRLNKQVGGALGISEITVKAHRGRLMRKMHAGSICDLVKMASRLGPWLRPTPLSNGVPPGDGSNGGVTGALLPARARARHGEHSQDGF